MNAPANPKSRKRISTTGGAMNVPEPIPALAIPEAVPRLLSKYKATITTAGVYMKALPTPKGKYSKFIGVNVFENSLHRIYQVRCKRLFNRINQDCFTSNKRITEIQKFQIWSKSTDQHTSTQHNSARHHYCATRETIAQGAGQRTYKQVPKY